MSLNLPFLKNSVSEKVLSKIPLPIEEEPELAYKPSIQLQPLYDFNPKSAFARASQHHDKSPDYKQKILEIMKYEQRTPQEAKLLYDYIQHFSFFESFNERNPYNHLETQAFIQLCQKVRYEKHPAKKVLYKEGDAPTGKVYLIVSGQVYTVNKNTDTNVTENSSHNEVTTIDDTTTENSAENTPKKDFEDSPFHNSPNMGFEGLVNYRMRRNSIRLTSNSRSPKDLNSSTPERRISEIKPGKASRLSIFVANSHDFHERDGSQSSLTKLGQKLKEVQEEKNSPQRAPKQGFANLMKMNLLANIQEGNSVTENEAAQENDEAALNITKLKRKKSLRFSSIERQNSQSLLESTSPVNKSFTKPYISLKQLANENGFVKCKVQQGGFFGERALFSKQPRLSTVITATDCEFLVINKKDFKEVSEKYDLKRRLVIDFMKEFIPEVEELTGNEIVDDMIYALEEKAFERDAYIIRENELANKFYLIYEGTCELIKKVQIDETANLQESLASLKKLIRVSPVSKEDLFICKMEKGEFIGEECVFSNRGVYDLSVRAYSANVKVFMIEKHRFFAKFHARTKEKMEKHFKNKRKNHVEIVNQLILKKYPMFVVINDEKADNRRDLLSRNHIRLVPKRRSELTPKIQHEHHIRNSFRTAKNFFNPNAVNNNVNSNGPSFDLDRKYKLNLTDLNDKPLSRKEEKFPESSKIEKSYSPTHKELKKKLEAFSRTSTTLKIRPQDNINEKSEISIQEGVRTEKTHKTFFCQKSIKLEALSPYFKPSHENSHQDLANTSSQVNSMQMLPLVSPNINYQESKVSLKVKEEQSTSKRQVSLGAYLKELAKDQKEISKMRNKTKKNISPKKLTELSSQQNEQKSSFAKVLEKMMHSAKARKNKRMNDSFTVHKTGFDEDINSKDETRIPFDNYSVNTNRVTNFDYWPNSPKTPNTPLSSKLKNSRSSILLIKTASISNSFSSTENSQENKISELFEKSDEIKDCRSAELPRPNITVKRSEVRKRSNFYQRTLQNKTIKNTEWREGNSKEDDNQSEYFGTETGSPLGKALNGLINDDSITFYNSSAL